MIQYIENGESGVLNDIYNRLCKIEELLRKFNGNDGDAKENLAIFVSQQLNDIKQRLLDDRLPSGEKQTVMDELMNQIGPILKFEDYSYEHEYRVIEDHIPSSKIAIDTKEFEEKVYEDKNVLKYKLDLSGEDNIFSSLIFGPKLQYDMIYSRFAIKWDDKPKFLLQKSEIHYR